MSEMPIGSGPSQASATRTWMHRLLQWIPFAFPHSIPLTFGSSNVFCQCLKRILSKSIRLLPCWFKFAGKQDVQSLIDPIIQSLADKRICTVWHIENPLEFLDLMKMWISCESCHTLLCRIQHLLLRLARISALLIYQGWLGGLETRIHARKWRAVAEIFAMQRDWSCWKGVDALLRKPLLSRARRSYFGSAIVQGHLRGPNAP